MSPPATCACGAGTSAGAVSADTAPGASCDSAVEASSQPVAQSNAVSRPVARGMVRLEREVMVGLAGPRKVVSDPPTAASESVLTDANGDVPWCALTWSAFAMTDVAESQRRPRPSRAGDARSVRSVFPSESRATRADASGLSRNRRLCRDSRRVARGRARVACPWRSATPTSSRLHASERTAPATSNLHDHSRLGTSPIGRARTPARSSFRVGSHGQRPTRGSCPARPSDRSFYLRSILLSCDHVFSYGPQHPAKAPVCRRTTRADTFDGKSICHALERTRPLRTGTVARLFREQFVRTC